MQQIQIEANPLSHFIGALRNGSCDGLDDDHQFVFACSPGDDNVISRSRFLLTKQLYQFFCTWAAPQTMGRKTFENKLRKLADKLGTSVIEAKHVEQGNGYLIHPLAAAADAPEDAADDVEDLVEDPDDVEDLVEDPKCTNCYEDGQLLSEDFCNTDRHGYCALGCGRFVGFPMQN